MVHGYKTIQHWDQWLTQHQLGQNLLHAEKQALDQLLDKHFGKHALLLGVPRQSALLKANSIIYHTVLSPFAEKDDSAHSVETNFHELPIATGSIDLVLLPHTLEFVDNPRQLLAEACRVIKPEGLIVICGFNPYSLWGLHKLFTKQKAMPWKANFIQASKVKSWLHLADFELEKHQGLLYRSPRAYHKSYQSTNLLECIGNKCFHHLGGVYVLLARAKVVPLMPIKMQWKQQLGGIRISTNISGNIARQQNETR